MRNKRVPAYILVPYISELGNSGGPNRVAEERSHPSWKVSVAQPIVV